MPRSRSALPAPPGHAPEPPWEELDPGIVGVVRSLWEAGFHTVDSGDGQAKGALGWDLDAFADVPHVVVRPEPGQLEATGYALLDWLTSNGISLDDCEGNGVSVDAFFVLGDDGQKTAVIVVGGEELYGWSSGEQPEQRAGLIAEA